jgi:uncharacterized protein YgbK (DUF1537 family)
MHSSSSPFAPEMPANVIILADDLTGACDSAVAFLASGRPVRVVLDSSCADARIMQHEVSKRKPTVWAFTTETRNLQEKHATESVANSIAALPSTLQNCIFFKKVDSAGRGHLGAETITAFQCTGATLALVALAFPQAGRTVQSGVLRIRDSCGQDATISLRELFPQMDSKHIETLPIGTELQMEQGISAAIANGTRILLCDAETQADLDRLAFVAYRSRHRILWTGSAGLARALASVLPTLPAELAPQAPYHNGQTLLFVGSSHPVTSRQLAHLNPVPDPLDRTVHSVRFGPASAQEIRATFSAAPVAALILTGGDTAALVLLSLDASTLVLAGEVAPGIPWGWIEGGAADRCIVVTKSGGFGEPNALAEAFEFCSRRQCEPA